MFGETAAGSDGGAASAGEIVAIGTEDAFDDAEMAQTGELSGGWRERIGRGAAVGRRGGDRRYGSQDAGGRRAGSVRRGCKS